MVIPPKIRYVEVDVDSSVGFDVACREHGYGYSFSEKKAVTWDLKCTGIGFAHGHVSISCDDGVGWHPFPVASLEGVQRLLRQDPHISDVEKAAILALDEVKALPVPMTSGELAIFEDPERLKVFTTYGYSSGF